MKKSGTRMAGAAGQHEGDAAAAGSRDRVERGVSSELSSRGIRAPPSRAGRGTKGAAPPRVPPRRGRGGSPARRTVPARRLPRTTSDVKPGTIFFNLSHEDLANRTYFLTGGGKSYRLTRVSDDPDVLPGRAGATRSSGACADQKITHHIEGTASPPARPTLDLPELGPRLAAPGPGRCPQSTSNWPSGLDGSAPTRGRARGPPAGPLPLSPKREMYGVEAAQREQDLREEQVLLDVNSQAMAILGWKPQSLQSRRSASEPHPDQPHQPGYGSGSLAQRAGRPSVRAGHPGAVTGEDQRRRMGDPGPGDQRRDRFALQEHQGHPRRPEPVHPGVPSGHRGGSPAGRWRASRAT